MKNVKKDKKEGSRVKEAVFNNKNLVIKQLRQEWEEAEKSLEKQKRKEQLIHLAKNAGISAGKGILALLVIGGVLTVAAVAPNIFAACGKIAKQRRYFKKDQLNRNKYYFKKRGLIKIKKINKDTFEMFLTEKGERRAIEEGFQNFKIQNHQKDGYWRVVMFDIPKKYNWARDAFRQKLKMMGFYQLQESVFVLPYPCEKEVGIITEILNIAGFVHLIKTKDFDDNRELKEIFN